MNPRHRFTITLALAVLAFALLLIAPTHATHAALRTGASSPAAANHFAVEFTNCVESIRVTLVPTDRARALVPPEFHLVGEGGPTRIMSWANSSATVRRVFPFSNSSTHSQPRTWRREL